MWTMTLFGSWSRCGLKRNSLSMHVKNDVSTSGNLVKVVKEKKKTFSKRACMNPLSLFPSDQVKDNEHWEPWENMSVRNYFKLTVHFFQELWAISDSLLQ